MIANITFCLRIVDIDHTLRVTWTFILAFLSQVDKFCQVIVWLGQMKRLWLASVISSASFTFKYILFRGVEVAWII